MINVYSINEIIAASEAILTKPTVKKKTIIDESFTTDKINESMELPINIKEKKLTEQSTSKEINNIIVDEKNLQIQKKIDKTQEQSNHKKEYLYEDFKVTKDELVESIYLTFSKKIKKNTIKLIIDLKEDIVFLTKNISLLKENKKIQNDNKKLLTKDIVNLKNTVNELNTNLSQVQMSSNILKEKNKNLNNDFNLLKDNYIKKHEALILLENQNNILVNDYKNKELESKSKIEKLEEEISTNNKLLHETNNQNNILVNDYKNKELESKSKIEKLEEEISTNNKLFDETNKIFHETNNNNDLIKSQISEINDYKQLNEKNQNLEKTIEDLRLSMSNNNGVNISDLENKIKHYQDENIRISSELVESDKRFAVTRDSLSALQDQRSDLIEKLNSINNVMKGENIISNVFDESTDKANTNQTPKKNKSTGNLDKQIHDIFSK